MKDEKQFMDVKGRTAAYTQALGAMRALMEVQGADAVSRAYAEVVADKHREIFATSRGLKESDGRLCVQRLVGKQCNLQDCMPPGGDHDTLWLRDGKPALYHMQPYGLSWDDMKKIVAFCERRGLQASVAAWPAFYSPGTVLSISIEKVKEDAPMTSQNNHCPNCSGHGYILKGSHLSRLLEKEECRNCWGEGIIEDEDDDDDAGIVPAI